MEPELQLKHSRDNCVVCPYMLQMVIPVANDFDRGTVEAAFREQYKGVFGQTAAAKRRPILMTGDTFNPEGCRLLKTEEHNANYGGCDRGSEQPKPLDPNCYIRVFDEYYRRVENAPYLCPFAIDVMRLLAESLSVRRKELEIEQG